MEIVLHCTADIHPLLSVNCSASGYMYEYGFDKNYQAEYSGYLVGYYYHILGW